MPDVNDFSNTNPYDGWIGGYITRFGFYARRQLSYQKNGKWVGGIANEWGCMPMSEDDRDASCQSYKSTDWNSYHYWTNNVATNTARPRDEGKPFLYAPEGDIDILQSIWWKIRAACVTP
ncbi:hypothetical protein [Gilliamella sp. A7]|uniref:hypothetical protein n=1 Tax=Gilliamella sp. A7 TaxID=1970465 RepID=UPI000A33997A|nr:hypothetical protein [Gilliamella sp. A7]OTQ54989.1 hypothetical protein B6D18_12380 [Gilliamella sp. A7]